ncbi:MAG TPA: hypothetical protein VMT12_04890, partial [Syntrophales bacterium]|nr:hypothetical protein [Syntrophales bacterium]
LNILHYKIKLCSLLKRYKTSDIISISSLVISGLALCFSYVVYKESRSIEFQWEVNSRINVPIRLIHEIPTTYKEKQENDFVLPIPCEFKITNTGSRTFTVDSVDIVLKTLGKESETRTFLINFLWFTMNLNPSEEININKRTYFPLVVEPGHSKVFFQEIPLPINKEIYNRYKKEFHGQSFSLEQIYILNKDELLVSNNFEIIAMVKLASGQYRSAYVNIDAVRHQYN